MAEKIRPPHLPPTTVPSQQTLLVASQPSEAGQHVMSIPKLQQVPGLQVHNSTSQPDIALHARPASSTVSGTTSRTPQAENSVTFSEVHMPISWLVTWWWWGGWRGLRSRVRNLVSAHTGNCMISLHYKWLCIKLSASIPILYVNVKHLLEMWTQNEGTKHFYFMGFWEERNDHFSTVWLCPVFIYKSLIHDQPFTYLNLDLTSWIFVFTLSGAEVCC